MYRSGHLHDLWCLDNVLTLTVSRLSPQILLDKPYNTSVDWFSAGVTLYILATGKHPFYVSIEAEKIKMSIIKDAPAYPEETS